jgi:hypothetical protein
MDSGSLYTVEIPEDADLLTYDDPISEQPPQVVAALTDLMDGKKPTGTGRDAYRALSRKLGGDQAASLALAEAGIPGHRFLDGNSRRKGEGSYNYVIYADDSVAVVTREQRRNVPPGPFDTFEHRSSHELGRLFRPSNWGQLRQAKNWADLRAMTSRTFSTSLFDLRRQQGAIEEAAGAQIPLGQDTYTIASLYVGRAGERLQKLYDGHVNPIVKAMDAAGIKSAEADDYLTALHAIEANEHVAKLYEIDKPDHQFVEALTDPDVVGGSGMSENQALKIIKAAEGGARAAAFKQVANRVRRMLDQALDLQVSSGLVSQDSADAMRATYKNYVPLRGYMDEEAEGGAGVGRGFDIRGQESKARAGRGSRSDSPIAYAFTQAANTVIRSEKNRVGKTFLRMVQANPNPAAWEVNRREMVKSIGKSKTMILDPITGDPVVVSQKQVKSKSTPPSRMADNVMIVKVGGKEVAITIYNPDIAAGLKNLNPENANMLIRAIGSVTRIMAALNTSWNIEWFAVNMVRDLQTAGIQISDENTKGLALAMFKNWPGALKGAAQYSSGRGSSAWRKVAEDFAMDGGKVSYIDFKGVEAFKDMISDRATEAKLGKMLKAGPGRALDAIDVITSTGENAIRIAAYKAAVDMGVPRTKAASIARELTVNFNRRGTASPTINALYMFFNAAVQGNARMLKSLATSKFTRKAVVGLAVMGWLEALLGAEDDDEYKKIDPWVRERNMVIMLSPLGIGDPGEYVKIPIPYGFNVFKTMGTEIGRMMFHGVGPGEAALTMLGAALNSFNPIGGQDFLAMATPTVLDPVSEVVRNESFMGTSIKPDYPNDKRPPSEQYFPNVNTWSKGFTAWLNETSGGNTFKPGAISLSPEQIDHLISAYTGGVGRLITRTFSTAGDIGAGRGVDAEKTPFVRNFYGRTFGEMPTWRAYDKVSDAAAALDYEIKGLSGAGLYEDVKTARARDPVLTRMIGPFKAHAAVLAKMRKMEQDVRASGMTDDQKDERLEVIRLRQYDIQRRAIEQYDRAHAAAKQ